MSTPLTSTKASAKPSTKASAKAYFMQSPLGSTKQVGKCFANCMSNFAMKDSPTTPIVCGPQEVDIDASGSKKAPESTKGARKKKGFHWGRPAEKSPDHAGHRSGKLHGHFSRQSSHNT
uniref:Uncharacterized protein n=1 Tax=Fibrocapsa japonica TaxID=94617 RepID=A0A7S2V435_9STRA|mmetsp:Transcript_631/g.911  ORF Transcript_631/g.911 Transcript_631/m.911 type:complete len:119 (+) Transcript_631:3-359(+)